MKETAVRRWVVRTAFVAAATVLAIFLLKRIPTHASLESVLASGQQAEATSRADFPTTPPAIASANKTSEIVRSSEFAAKSSDAGESKPAPDSPTSGYGTPTTYAPPKNWRQTVFHCWGLRGTAPEDFAVETDSNLFTSGKSSATLRSIRDTFGWGTLYQFADAKPLRGKRIEFSADIRTEDVQRGANLFVRADDGKGVAVATDNMWYSFSDDRSDDRMVNRTITGDTEWTTQRIVLDIPTDAAVISYGVSLWGAGKVWIENALLETTARVEPLTAHVRPDTELKETAILTPLHLQSAPKNLDFESGVGDAECE